ncbi:MAG: ATP phosphoribosyltransferase regulatory subunit [Lentisphaeria bacterium]
MLNPTNKVDRWLLPDGIEEVLPAQAGVLEHLRRAMIDLFETWGYDYVVPPMVEFTDSLLTGSGQDIDLLTFKLTDQISGKTMGIRADITPQAARMDAHSLKREGVNRLCYAGHVMHTKAKSPLGSRAPLKTGVELFGEAGIDADVEIVSLLLEALSVANIEKQYIDLGHVGIFRALAEAADLGADQEIALFKLLQTKSTAEVSHWLAENVDKPEAREWLEILPKLAGNINVIKNARQVFASAPDEVFVALDELEAVHAGVAERFPDAQFYFDLSELRGYHYHTGIVFGAFAPGVGNAIASGGRYDRIGEAFGRARPATGFDVDLTAICRIQQFNDQRVPGIFAPLADAPQLWQKICELRARGERVICGLSDQLVPFEHQNCDRQLLVSEDGSFMLEAL